jgi:hypothetical protein
MSELKGRALIEDRFGPLGSGAQVLTIAGTEFAINDILFRMGLLFDDAKPIDLLALGGDRYVVRYFDAQDQRIVAYEFDSQWRFVGETRAHVAEWIGEDAYFSEFSGH